MPLVLLHPVGLDGNCWQFLTSPRLADAVRYDQLWHGSRPKPAVEPMTIATMADDVVENVEGPLDVVGLSMGGATALQVAIRHPDRVRSLMLCCSSPGGGGGAALEERARAVEETGMAGVMDVTLRRWFSAAARETPDHPGVKYVIDRLMSDDPASFAASWRALGSHDSTKELGSITAPTTVLHAAEDAAGPIEDKKAMADAIPGARFVVIPGPHMVQLELPETYQTALLEHLDWVDEQTR